MTFAILILAVVAVSLWLAPRKRSASRTQALPQRERELSGLRDRYVAEEITLEDFERQAADALDPKPREYSERVEVHVWNAPAGSALHIHLP